MRSFVTRIALVACAILVAVMVVFGLEPAIACWESGLRGVVVDVRTGRPVEGVDLRNVTADDDARTTSDGSFRLGWVDHVATSLQPVVVFKAGVGVCQYERDWVRKLHGEETESAPPERIELLPMARLVVRVEGVDGNPLRPDAVAVDLAPERGDLVAERHGFALAPGPRVRPYALLRERLDGELATQYDVTANYAIRWVSVRVGDRTLNRGPLPALIPQEARELIVRVPRETCTVRGKVTVANHQDVRGRVSWRCGDSTASAVVEPDGTYALSHVECGSITIRLFLERPHLQRTTSIEVTRSMEAVCDFDVTFDWSQIRGVLVDAEFGLPIVEAPIEARARQRDEASDVLRTVTDADGWFVVRLPPDAADTWDVWEVLDVDGRGMSFAIPGEEKLVLKRW